MEIFIFTYYKKSDAKYFNIADITQTCQIAAVSAPAAIDIFEASVGNLRTKYVLVEIQQVDARGNKIGEPIVMGDVFINKEKVN
jgi:hypothetical protein